MARAFQQRELFMGSPCASTSRGYRVRNQRVRLWSDLVTAGALHPAPDAERARCEHLIDLLGLRSVADTAASALPLGTARRVEVARALATGPSIVLLDEPSSGLDRRETSQLGAALRSVVDEEQVSLLLVEHDVAIVLGLSSEVAVLDFGPRHPRRDPQRRGCPRRLPR
jgi:branched-chain amino acid transport system ATP-binding protein